MCVRPALLIGALRVAMLCAVAPLPSLATAPILYTQPAFESVVRGDPDDLILIAGDGLAADDVVVYQATGNTEMPAAPDRIPDVPGAELGYASVIGTRHVPYSLTVRLPTAMRPRTTYTLWVRSPQGEWSRPLPINDARPLWLTPPYVYAQQAVAGLPRALKLVGANLDPSPTAQVRVRLSGPETRTVIADRTDGAEQPYVTRIRLPASLRRGSYRVEVSRDQTHWVELPGQRLEVRPDPAASADFDISDPHFGGCRPDEGTDAAACIVRAIEAARNAGGGTVVVGPGHWELLTHHGRGSDGILLPTGISLRGAGIALTRLTRGTQWTEGPSAAAFTLLGGNKVEGFTFADARIHAPRDAANAFIHLGEHPGAGGSNANTVSDLVITHNRFDRTDSAIAAGGKAMSRLFITYDEFGAYGNALELGGDIYALTSAFRIDDSVISHNLFRPGSLLDVAGARGPIASEIGASHRLDFSENVADGASLDYLNSRDDPRGWRAGFFWHMNDNQEMLLISENNVTCSADKVGDGEAIALDNSGNTFAFEAVRPVIAAQADSVTVAGPLASRQFDRDVPLATYYVGHWVQVGDGPGLGQARKIVSYTTDAATGRVTFRVAPDWDVVPATGHSRISVGREFWQTLLLNNHVDHRQPLCQKSNRSRDGGGVISLWAQLADSVVAGNQLHDTDGILFHQNTQSPRRMCPGCGSEFFFQSFLDIRNNEVEGRYDSASDCAPAGIRGGVSAAPEGHAPPPTLGYGLSISHNHLVRADTVPGGAISVAQDWYAGPPPHAFPLLDSLIVAHNRIEVSSGPITGKGCNNRPARRGISFPDAALVWNSVLYANACTGIGLPLGPGGKATTRDCSTAAADSCECRTARPAP